MRPAAVALVACSALLSAAEAREPWQLGHGPFVTAADVTAHNKFPLDMAEIRAFLASDKPDWPAALSLYAYGKHFKAHSVGRFADNYNGRLEIYLPASSRYFGSPSFQNAVLFSALAGTGPFARASEAQRRAILDAGMTALIINYARYELGEAERKAKDEKPNWSLQNGSPKNWNEVFAFYFGPEGRHAAFAVVAKLPAGDMLNSRILDALATGQSDLIERKWAPEAARALGAALDAASLALLRDALEQASAAANPDAATLAQARAAGFWLAAAEPVLRIRGPESARAVTAAFTGPKNAEALHKALALLAEIPGP
jgi:hypothetical protein